MAAEEALKKLEEQLSCSICQDTYTDPKQLKCNHIFCQDCLLKPAVRDLQGYRSLTCPKCRDVTLGPPKGVEGLKPASHINHLLEIVATLKKHKETPGSTIELASSLNPVSYCSEHSRKELELYCETCGESICCYCALIGGKHQNHVHKFLSGVNYEQHSKQIILSFEPIKQQLKTIDGVLAQVDRCCGEITGQQTVIEEDIHNTMKRLHEVLYARETVLNNGLHELTQSMLKELAVQKDQLETTQAQLSSCLEFMEERLKASSLGEIQQIKEPIIKQVKELTSTFQHDTFQPKAEVNIEFSTFTSVYAACESFGQLSTCGVVPVALLQAALTYDTPSLVIEGLSAPWGVVTNHRGEIVVTEENGHCVSVFSLSGEKLKSFGTLGPDFGQFDTPHGVTMDSDGNVLVVDTNNHRLQKFTTEGQLLATVGTKGNGPLQFKDPKDIVLNLKNNKLYVIDDNPCVQILNSDLSFFGTFGTKGKGNGQFEYPCGITCDSTGKVYVADSGNGRIQVFTAEGEFVRVFGRKGNGKGELGLPIGVATSSSRFVCVSDYYNHRVSVFTSEGQFLTSFGKPGKGSGQFEDLGSLAIGNGRLYVCDRNNDRVQIFNLLH